uniref:Transcription factor CBF/NF-Y/archaeal histone domain-containing protein n=1 Tax=Kalanchoe fedtschenkoi TaxID=63787 RepID=A0A7N0V5A7_KALFE
MGSAPGSPAAVGGDYKCGGQSPNLTAREKDKFLPVANISRIMKIAVPPNGKIANDAKDIVQECTSEFISFITSEASDKCQKKKRKTINGDDILWAMSLLGFEEYIEPLRVYLAKYRKMEGDSKAPAKSGVSSMRGGGGKSMGFPSSASSSRIIH